MCCDWRLRGWSASLHVVAMMPSSGMIGSGTSNLALCSRWGGRAWCTGCRSRLTLSSCAMSMSPPSTGALPSPSRQSTGWISRSSLYTATCAAPSRWQLQEVSATSCCWYMTPQGTCGRLSWQIRAACRSPSRRSRRLQRISAGGS
jgi:hypothetical protein